MATYGWDAHRDFGEVAVREAGKTRRIGRVATDPQSLAGFASRLGPDDVIVLESTSFAWPLVEAFQRASEARVIVSNPAKNKAIAAAKVKSDKVDARVLAELGDAGLLVEVWVPPHDVLVRRRLVAYRAQLVRHRTSMRRQAHAIWTRQLLRCPHTDAFGPSGRRWVAELELPAHERLQLDGLLALHDAAGQQLKQIERELAELTLGDPIAKLLMSIPGIAATGAAAISATIGDPTRFESAKHLVGYFGLDPRVRQSGNGAYRTGSISKQGSTYARSLLVEAARSAVRTPGPLRAFYERLRARKGPNVAACAVARKLLIISWHMLKNGETYRYSLPSLHDRKLRELQKTAGQTPTVRDTYRERRAQERALLEQAERSYTSQVRARASQTRHAQHVNHKGDNHGATGSQPQPALHGRAHSRPREKV